ncbi:hypothetical protein NGRA_2992 [Nosema granulosis]|uniref:Uncharacterized protein n=1 Tax=Nosema granulosis TaxID=83296 RepID=A0A9P6GVM0_9MICR|nr:hypothetical protein NGRA_2992 [Nosema granulosis]
MEHLQEEFKETVEKINQGDLKLLNTTLKDLAKTPEDFLVFYSTIMAYPVFLEYTVYRSLIAPLNNSNQYQEIPKLYIKIISTLMKTQRDKDILDFIGVIYNHPVSYLKKIFSTPANSCLQTSLIMFGEDLFLKGWEYESYKAMYVGSLNITLTGIFPSMEIMTKYLTTISCYFLKEGYFYSFLNAASRLKQLEIFGSREQFEKIAKYCEYKNEGMEFSQLLCKMPYTSSIGDINSTTTNGYIAKYVDFTKWDYYIRVIGSEVEIHDLSFVSFLKRNNIQFEINNKKVRVGEYKFRSISDNICDIIEFYTPKKVENSTTKNTITKNTTTINTTTINTTTKNTPKKIVRFRDNFILKKAKFTIYCDIFSKNFKEINLKNEERDRNRRERFERMQKEQESRKNDLKKYSETLKDLREILKARAVKYDRKEVEFKSPAINKTVAKTSWRDIEVEREPIIRSTYRTYKKEEDILSTRSISSFDGEANSNIPSSAPSSTPSNIYIPPPPSAVLKNSTPSNIYRPPPPSAVLKNFNKDTLNKDTLNKDTFNKDTFNKDTNNKDTKSKDTKSNLYVPPHLRKNANVNSSTNTNSSTEEKKKTSRSWRD